MLTSTSSLITNECRIPEVCTDITLLLLRLCMWPSKQSISQTSTWRPWLKTTCSGALGKTDCAECRWPPQHSLLIFLIAGVTEMEFCSPSSHTHTQPFVLVGLVEGVYECAPKEPDTAWLQWQKDESNKPYLCVRTGLSHHWLPFWKNSDIWWKEGKSIPEITSHFRGFTTCWVIFPCSFLWLHG